MHYVYYTYLAIYVCRRIIYVCRRIHTGKGQCHPSASLLRIPQYKRNRQIAFRKSPLRFRQYAKDVAFGLRIFQQRLCWVSISWAGVGVRKNVALEPWNHVILENPGILKPYDLGTLYF